MNTSMIDYAAQPAGNKPVHRIDYHGKSVKVPEIYWDQKREGVNLPALLKSNQDLRRKLSEKAGGKAPSSYSLRMPEGMAKSRRIAEDDPLAKAAMDWAGRHGLPQEAFDELVEAYVRQEAEQLDPAKFREVQMAALKEEYGHRCDEVCKDVGHWFGALMQADFEGWPELREVAEELASDARGVMLLKAIRDRLSERGVPGGQGAPAGALDKDGLRRMQASEPYLNSRHPDHAATVRRVREGWQNLVGRS